MSDTQPEYHPLEPFLPEGTRILILGSFPPPRPRWTMDFFYPNWINDFWRIVGTVFFGDKDRFVVPGQKTFDRQSIISFLTEKKIAMSDTARAVVRKKGNASDAHLQIVESVDLASLLERIPECEYIVTTGERAAETLAALTSTAKPAVGEAVEIRLGDRALTHFRMPSTSRAYPLPLADKAEAYGRMFRQAGIL